MLLKLNDLIMFEICWYPALLSIFLFSFFFYLFKEPYSKLININKKNKFNLIKNNTKKFVADYYFLLKFIYKFSIYMYILMYLSNCYFFYYKHNLIFFNLQIFNYSYVYFNIITLLIIFTLYILNLTVTKIYNKSFEFLIGLIFFFTCIQYYLITNNLIALILIFEFQSLVLMYLIANGFNMHVNYNIYNSLRYNNFVSQPIWYFNSLIYQFWVSFIGALLLIYTALSFFKFTSFNDWLNFEIYTHMKNNLTIDFSYLQLIKLFLPLVLGLFLKLGSLPFFLWKPEIYKNFNLNILFIYMSLYSFSVLYFFIIFINNYLFLLKNFIYPYVYILAILTFIFISIIIYAITEIRAFLAYTSILHINFILLPMFMHTLNSTAVSYFYLFIYLFFIFFIFFIFFSLNNNTQLWYFTDIQFFFKNTPIMTGLGVVLVSMAGIPPFLGFFAKLSAISLFLLNEEYLLFLLALFSGFFVSYFYLQNYRFYGYNLKNLNYSKNLLIVKNNFMLYYILYLCIFINVFGFLFVSDLLIFANFLSNLI